MIVCQCERVNDAQVRMAIEVGAASISAIKAATKAGTDCGTCTMTLCTLLKSERPDLNPERIDACLDGEADPVAQVHTTAVVEGERS